MYNVLHVLTAEKPTNEPKYISSRMVLLQNLHTHAQISIKE